MSIFQIATGLIALNMTPPLDSFVEKNDHFLTYGPTKVSVVSG